MYQISRKYRGTFKVDLIKEGFPVQDNVGYKNGDKINIKFENSQFKFRDYQTQSINSFLKVDSILNSKNETKKELIKQKGSSGVIVLPCGAGKTIVGIGILVELGMKTLIITPNVTSIKQWKKEIIRLTSMREENIGEFYSEIKEIKPITITTYQILIYKKNQTNDSHYFSIFEERNWGLIIYDEIHLLPAPIFRTIINIQSKRQLGLTATLVREDNCEKDVFALVGSKKYDMPWKDLEKKKFLAKVECFEVKVPLDWELIYENYEKTDKNFFRIVSENRLKINSIKKILKIFPNEKTLIIGQFITQIAKIAKNLNLPLITGSMKNKERAKLYLDFQQGKIDCLVVSKVANMAIDLPNASLCIQVSGAYGF